MLFSSVCYYRANDWNCQQFFGKEFFTGGITVIVNRYKMGFSEWAEI